MEYKGKEFVASVSSASKNCDIVSSGEGKEIERHYCSEEACVPIINTFRGCGLAIILLKRESYARVL